MDNLYITIICHCKTCPHFTLSLSPFNTASKQPPLYVTGDDLTPDAPRVGISFFFRYYQHFKILGR